MSKKRRQKHAKPLVHVRPTHPMWRYGNDPKQSRITALIGALLATVMCVWILLSLNGLPVWVNDQRRDMLARDVFNYELPERTEVIERDYGMAPAGDGSCAFTVTQSMRTYLSPAVVDSHYREAEFRLRIPDLANLTLRTAPELRFASTEATDAGILFQLQVRIVVPDSRDARCQE